MAKVDIAAVMKMLESTPLSRTAAKYEAKEEARQEKKEKETTSHLNFLTKSLEGLNIFDNQTEFDQVGELFSSLDDENLTPYGKNYVKIAKGHFDDKVELREERDSLLSELNTMYSNIDTEMQSDKLGEFDLSTIESLEKTLDDLVINNVGMLSENVDKKLYSTAKTNIQEYIRAGNLLGNMDEVPLNLMELESGFYDIKTDDVSPYHISESGFIASQEGIDFFEIKDEGKFSASEYWEQNQSLQDNPALYKLLSSSTIPTTYLNVIPSPGATTQSLWDSPEAMMKTLNEVNAMERDKFINQNYYLDTDGNIQGQRELDSKRVATQWESWADAMAPIVGLDNITPAQELYNKGSIGIQLNSELGVRENVAQVAMEAFAVGNTADAVKYATASNDLMASEFNIISKHQRQESKNQSYVNQATFESAVSNLTRNEANSLINYLSNPYHPIDNPSGVIPQWTQNADDSRTKAQLALTARDGFPQTFNWKEVLKKHSVGLIEDYWVSNNATLDNMLSDINKNKGAGGDVIKENAGIYHDVTGKLLSTDKNTINTHAIKGHKNKLLQDIDSILTHVDDQARARGIMGKEQKYLNEFIDTDWTNDIDGAIRTLEMLKLQGVFTVDENGLWEWNKTSDTYKYTLAKTGDTTTEQAAGAGLVIDSINALVWLDTFQDKNVGISDSDNLFGL